MQKRLNDWLKMIKDLNGSDLHLCSRSLPYMRIHGEIKAIDDFILDNDYLKDIFFEILTPNQRNDFYKKGI